MSDEQLQRTIQDQATVTDITPIHGRSSLSGIAQQIKSGALTPEDALKAAEEHFAKTGRKFTLPSLESRRSKYEQDEQERQNFELYKQPFLDPNFSPNGDFWLGPGLNLIGGKSGQGKTTTAANILAGFVSHRPDTTAVVILNEEKGGTLLQRTACVLLKKSFAKFFHKGMFPAEEDEVRSLAEELISRIVIVDSDPYDTNCLEDIKTIITGAPSAGANLVLLDYYQNVNHSRDNPGMEPYKILKELGFFLKEYGRANKVPLGVFCQLKSDADAKDFKDRVENDKTVFNHAYNCLEIKPDKETGLTEFIVWKQRFAYEQFYKVVLKYDGGRYVPQEARGL